MRGDEDDFQCQCECGLIWSMDFDPTPETCSNTFWRMRLGDNGEWGPWLDEDGNSKA